ncbi:hypothetical protein GCM10010149_38730 [Nonomuraea roseoviolacea subsp. roseoviolacea]
MALNGIVWEIRSGSSWRDVPERYGSEQSLHTSCTAVVACASHNPSGDSKIPRPDENEIRQALQEILLGGLAMTAWGGPRGAACGRCCGSRWRWRRSAW